MIIPPIQKPHLTEADQKLGRLFCWGRKILFLAIIAVIALRASGVLGAIAL